MRGVGLAKRQIADFLEAQIPAHFAALRLLWDMTEAQLPDPRRYSHNPLRALDQYPAISVSAARTPRIRRIGYLEEAPGTTYDTTYSMRVFVWANAVGWDDTIDMRDAITTAVRVLLVQSPTIGVANEAAVVIEETMIEEFSDVTKVGGDRFVAGSFIAFELRCAESLVYPPAANSATPLSVLRKRVVGAPLPHPAL